MPTPEENQAQPRRIAMRRARGNGFGQGSSTHSESLRTPVEHVDADEVDDSIDPQSVHNQIVTRANTYQPPEPDAPINPRARMQQVAQAGSAAFAKEYRLDMLRRQLLRRVPLDQIALSMGVSISTLEKDRVELGKRMREHARQLDINEIVGNQVETYAEISGMAMRMASAEATPAAMRLASMRTALASEADKTRFLNTSGVFDVLRYRKSEDGTDVSDVQLLMNSTKEMFDLLLADESETPPPARTRRPVRPARAGGFGKLTMDDPDASGSGAEEVEL